MRQIVFNINQKTKEESLKEGLAYVEKIKERLNIDKVEQDDKQIIIYVNGSI